MLWQRVCQLSGASKDTEVPPELDNEPIFRQLAAHSKVYAGEDASSLISFKEFK
jgi:predicted dienelactone hydrolase